MRGGRRDLVVRGILGLGLLAGSWGGAAEIAWAQTAPTSIVPPDTVPSPLLPSQAIQSPIVQTGRVGGLNASRPQPLTGPGVPTSMTATSKSAAPMPLAPAAPSSATPPSGAGVPVLTEALPSVSQSANGAPSQNDAASASPSATGAVPMTVGAPQSGQAENGQTGTGSSLANHVPTAPDKDLTLNTAILGGLNKITAQVATIIAPVGKPVHFGTLEIIARACRKHPPEESPESGAFLDIWELRPGHAAKSAFRGWMFSSSPAVSAMENPIYDIWVRDCRNTAAGNQP